MYQPVSDHGSTPCVCVCASVYVHTDLESRELMQAGLWQSSCPSARLIMQERHSRPPFILPGGEAVPACSAYHMAPAPPQPSSLSSLLSRSFSLYWGCCGSCWCWWWRKRRSGFGLRSGWGLLVECWNATARSIAFFLPSTLLSFFLSLSLSLSSPFTSPFCGCESK